MKSAKQREGKEELPFLQRSIKKSTAGKKCQKSSGVQRKNKSDVPSKCGIPTEQGDCDSDTSPKPGTFSKMVSDINQGNPKLQYPSKVKLQLFPLDETIRTRLEKDGHNPFLELTLSARKKISSVLTHLFNKWGSSSIAVGELMLFPFNAVVEDLTSYKSWSSSDIGITAGDVHSAVGNPEIFRLRYGWLSFHSNSSVSPLVCSHLEHVSSCTMEASSGAEMKSKELVTHMDQVEENNNPVQPSHANEIENGTAEVEKTSSAEPIRHEEAMNGRDFPESSFLWSDLSNISIGGLLSEASLQGRFNTPGMKSGNSRSTFQPNTVMAESLDAFINQLKTFDSSTTIHMPSSILDAEDTCHSFGLSKPSSAKDFLSLGRSVFSGLSSQDTGSRPSRHPKSEGNVQNIPNGSDAVQKPNAEPLPCSAGVFNNENSLGLSSIRWNDSLGPFDLPLIPREIPKDDSISIGGFVR